MLRVKTALTFTLLFFLSFFFPLPSTASVSVSTVNSVSSITVSSHTSTNVIPPVPTMPPFPTHQETIPTQRLSFPPLRVKKITPTPTNIPSSPTPKLTNLTLSNQQIYMITAINDYRAKNGLYAIKPDSYTCAFASLRAKEIVGNFNHDGFTSRVNNKSLPYPSYHSVTENIAMTSDYKQVVFMWINSPGHAANMRKDTPYVCVAESGNYFAYEGWKP